MRLILVLSLLTQLFASVFGDSANRRCNEDFDNSTEIQGLWNWEQPFGVHLSGIYNGSLAYATLKDRMPKIVSKVINTLSSNNEEFAKKYGSESLEELPHIIDSLNRLNNEMRTNQHLTNLSLAHNEADRDAVTWNDYLELRRELEGTNLSWFFTRFLLSECYGFRRISQAFALTKHLTTFDPFEKQKQDSFTNSIDSLALLARHTVDRLNKSMNASAANRELVTFLKLSLWANRFDLAASSGEDIKFDGNPVELLNSFEEDLLIDDTEVVWDILSNENRRNDFVIIDIVLDNAGYELFADLCLASFLTAQRIAHKVRFHVKQIPWFVSDVNTHDFKFVIDHMRNSSDPDLKQLGDFSAKHLELGSWSIEVEPFWTTYYDYGEMKKQAPALYNKLSEAALVIFKGDLNYRKLLGDINWKHDTTLDAALFQLDFQPSNIVILRTMKSLVCVGLTADQVQLWKKDKISMGNGKFGVIDAAVYAAPCACAKN